MDRIKSLDVLRTFIILDLMTNFFFVGTVPSYFMHADWAGCTLADWVFPGFIIMMCILVPMLVESKMKNGFTQKEIIIYGFKKFALLMFLGFFLHLFPDFNFETFRIPGVLQRNGIIFFGSIILYLILRKITSNSKKQIYILLGLFVFILFGYYLIGRPFNFLGLEQKFDFYFFKGHMYYYTYDPEGIVSTIGAFGTGIIAMVLGILKGSKEIKSDKVKATIILVTGIVFIILAHLFSGYMPIVKKIWTSTFVLLSGGYIFVLYGIIYFVVDIYKLYKPGKFVNILSKYTLELYVTGYLISTIISRVKYNGIPIRVRAGNILISMFGNRLSYWVFFIGGIIFLFLMFIVFDKAKRFIREWKIALM